MTNPPADLRRRGRAFWRRILARYEPRADERETLAEACRVLDRLDTLRALVAAEGLTTTTARGQKVMHPAVIEERLQRILLTRLLGTLGVDEAGQHSDTADNDVVLSMRSIKARKAARARWGSREAAR